MFEQLFEKLNMVELDRKNIWRELSMTEKGVWFFTRTNLHIHLVQEAAKQLVETFPEYHALLLQVQDHDSSKFEEPEMSPYIELTWNKKNDIEAGPDLQRAITAATLHHIKTNSHHPEYHLEDKTKANLDSTNRDNSIEMVDAIRMPSIDVAEMICDWQAMSKELGTNTAREWYDQVKDVRWHFSEEQDQLIDKLLKVFEKKVN